MLGFPSRYRLSPPPTITQPNPTPFLFHPYFPFPSPAHLKSPKTQTPPHLFAQNNTTNNQLSKEPNNQNQQQPTNNPNSNNGGDNSNNNNNNEEEDGDRNRREGRPPLLNIKWGDLFLDPDPDNILAVGLTGLLTWASVQVLWNLFFIALAILVAAVKYSFIAALLIFILVTLL